MDNLSVHLWFDNQAKEAAAFYTSVFPNSRILHTAVIHDTPSGDCEQVVAELMGRRFEMLSAGPLFEFNPSISFLVSCPTSDEVDRLWQQLEPGGLALMPLGSYPFSERYGWLKDKFGLSWQIMLRPDSSAGITPTLMFVGEQAGRAEEAMTLYTGLFAQSDIGHVMRYGVGEEPDAEGSIKHAGFRLAGEPFAVMDSAHEHAFNFNEAISLKIDCSDQSEIDRFWEALSADPSAEQCGWLKDRFGVSWQVNPSELDEMLRTPDLQARSRVTEAFLQMKKFDLDALRRAYRGE